MSLSDVLTEIDTLTAPECAQCGGPLTGSPSDDFCGPACQERWHTLRSYELVGYREPLYEWATLGPYPEDFDSWDLDQPRTAPGSVHLTLIIDTSRFEAAICHMNEALLTWWDPGAFEAALRPADDRAADGHIEVCGECSTRSDAARHAARLGLEVADLRQEAMLSWPALSMRSVVPESQPPQLVDPSPIQFQSNTTGPQRRERAPRTLGRMR